MEPKIVSVYVFSYRMTKTEKWDFNHSTAQHKSRPDIRLFSDYLLTNEQPRLNISMRWHVQYKLPGMCTWQVLINFDPNEDILFLDVWQVAENPVSQVCFTSILMIGTSGESSKGRCDRLIHSEEHSSLSNPPPSLMSVTVWGFGRCRQVKLVYIIICVYCTVSPTPSLHYWMNLSIKKRQCKAVLLNASAWQETILSSCEYASSSALG